MFLKTRAGAGHGPPVSIGDGVLCRGRHVLNAALPLPAFYDGDVELLAGARAVRRIADPVMDRMVPTGYGYVFAQALHMAPSEVCARTYGDGKPR